MPVILPETAVTATVWTVASAPGGAYPANAARVHTMVAEASKILRQVAVKVTWSGTLYVTNRADWLNITLTNGDAQAVNDITAIASGTGGIELYFVNSMTAAPGGEVVLGINTRDGMILTRGASAKTVAHEFGHALGLRDIYAASNDGTLVVDGPATEARLPGDWGGGYYEPVLPQIDLIQRLLMFGVEYGGEPVSAADLPYGGVYGVWYEWDDSVQPPVRVWNKSQAPVGWQNRSRAPAHQ